MLHISELAITRYTISFVEQATVPFNNGGFYEAIQRQCRDHCAVASYGRLIVLPYHMQNHAVVCAVQLVLMEVPVGGFDMDFDAPNPKHPVDRNAGFGEIRSGVGVPLAGANNGKRQMLVGCQPFLFEILEAPDKIQ